MIRLLLILICLLLAPASTNAQAPVLLRGPYLQMAKATALTIRWRTDIPGTGLIRCGTAENALTLSFPEAAAATDHVVRLTGLNPATRYFYAVETDGTGLAAGATCFFTTPPVTGANVPVRFWVLGDPGTQTLAQRQVRDAFAPLHAERRADLWLMLGDNAYFNCTDALYQGALFNTYPDYLKQLPLWSCIGNHEVVDGVDAEGKYTHDRIFTFPTGGECGGVASGTERYYSYDYGPIHFICLDSMSSSRVPGAPMALWLEADLQANTQPWVVAFWHHPPYSKGTHNSDAEVELIQMREYILPILEDYGVDLVLCGHSHNYERSYLINGHYGHSSTLSAVHKKGSGSGRPEVDGPYYKAGVGMTPHQGAVYITAGSSGQLGFGLLNHPAHFVALNRLGSVVVDVNGTRMDVRFLREATSPGAAPVFDDSFTIIKGEEPPPLPQLLRGPYLQKAAPSAMTVRWRTSIAGIGRIRYGTAPGVLTNLVAELAAEENHTVRLTGLTPGTKYYYQVETTGLTLAGGPNFFFTTPPPAGSTGPVRVWVLGDAGTQNVDQQRVRDAFIPIHAEKPADLWLMLGDNAYGSGRDLEYQRAVFDMYHPWLEQLPLWSCIGNHETYENPDAQGRFAWDRIFDNPAAAECGGVASGTGRYYSWDYAHIHFVCLDSMIASRAANGPMAQWLTADLQANTQQWTIAFWHHPPYTKGTHDSDYEDELIEMRTNLLPILENYGVDLVLCGHSHVYERSFLLDRHYGTSDLLLPANILNAGDGREDGDGIYVKPSQGPAAHEGAVFIVAGCSGQSGSGELNHPAHFVSLDGLGSVVLDIEDNRLEARFLRDTSAGPQPVFADWFTLLKGGPALPAAPSALNVLATGDTTALINWTDNSDNEVRFEIFLAGSGGPFALTGIFPSGTTGCILTGLTDGQEYHVKVIAANAAGSASSAVFTFTHDKNAPAHTPVERWRFLHWGTTNAGGGRDPDFDADGDDSVNLLEYALGSAPRINSSQPLFSTGRAPDGRLTVSFNRTADPALLYAVEFSATLAPGSWAAVWTSTGVNNTTGPVTVTDPQANASRRFVRLRVTMP